MIKPELKAEIEQWVYDIEELLKIIKLEDFSLTEKLLILLALAHKMEFELVLEKSE